MMAVWGCGSVSTPTLKSPEKIVGATAVPTPSSTRTATASATEPAESLTVTDELIEPIPALGSVRQSGEQLVWTNEGKEADVVLVALQATRAQVEKGESTLITAAAMNRSGSPLDIGLIIQTSSGLSMTGVTGCTGNPCITGMHTVQPGQQQLVTVNVTTCTQLLRFGSC